MKQSGNGYKLSKFVQKIFADFIGDTGAIDEGFYSLFCGADFDRDRGDFQFATVYPLCYNAYNNS